MKLFIVILLLSFFYPIILSQDKPFREYFETDSTNIEIIRNSVYKITTQTYKYKDSVWYQVLYIQDTNRLYTQGWHDKSGKKYYDVWDEFDFDGTWIYSYDYENDVITRNIEKFKYFYLIENGQQHAENWIIKAYGKQFFDDYIRFDNNVWAYYNSEYVGRFDEPMSKRPNRLNYRYSIHMGSLIAYNMIEVEIDTIGNLLRYGEIIDIKEPNNQEKKFVINSNKAMDTLLAYGYLAESDSVFCENVGWMTRHFFDLSEYSLDSFYYYLIRPIGSYVETYSRGERFTYFLYKVYIFNPWDGTFLEKRIMRSSISIHNCKVEYFLNTLMSYDD